MHLSDLCGAAAQEIKGGTNPAITAITADSRAVTPGALFAALPGSTVDGRDFIMDAVGRGAAAILAPEGTVLPPDAAHLPMIAAPDPRRAFALVAARFFDEQPAIAAAVTGTNGKTSVAWFSRRLWSALGHKAASIGTLGIDAPGTGLTTESGLTTADPVTLHADLSRLSDAEIGYVVIEASSHGLDQSRLDGVRFAAGAFTNLSRDHLDYHGTMEAYRQAKQRLFDRVLPEGAGAVLNADTPEYDGWSALCQKRGLRVISYGKADEDFRLTDTQPHPAGQKITFSAYGRTHELTVPIAGTFQAENILCALGLVVACGDDAEAAIDAASGLTAPPGRLEMVSRMPNGAAIYIDYAHTPDALSTVLKALRPHTDAALSVVFGCGGDRDRGKRPEMGAAAQQLADRVIVTDDNPRGEDAAAIRAEIMPACPDAQEIADRAEAIETAIDALETGDLLVIAGKGHETGQIIGDRVEPFEDRAVAQEAAARRGGSHG